MSSRPADFGGLETTKNVIGCEGSASGVAADESPLRLVLDLDLSVDLRLLFYKFIETYVLKQFLEMPVIASDLGGERRPVVVLLQYLVGGLAVHAHPLDVDTGICPGLLLKDGEDVPVKA